MDGIGKMASGHVNQVLTSMHPSSHDLEMVGSCIFPALSESSKTALDNSFTREEIIIAVKSMHPNKAPSSDEAHVIFYQKLWEVVGADLILVRLAFFLIMEPLLIR